MGNVINIVNCGDDGSGGILLFFLLMTWSALDYVNFTHFTKISIALFCVCFFFCFSTQFVHSVKLKFILVKFSKKQNLVVYNF